MPAVIGKQSSAAECVGDLSSAESDTHEVAAGEQEDGRDDKADDATEREIWRKLSKN